MSILSSTNSGKQTQLTEDFLLSSGWKVNVELHPVKIYRYIPKILQTDKPLFIAFNDKLEYYLYKGKYKNINIDFHIKTIGELQELISYYFNELKNPTEAFLSIKNNKNIELSFDYESNDKVSYSTADAFYKNYN